MKLVVWLLSLTQLAYASQELSSEDEVILLERYYMCVFGPDSAG